MPASAYLATVATALAEVTGRRHRAPDAVYGLPLPVGSLLVAAASTALLMSSSYKRVERWIVAFVSLIGISFLFELALVHVDWAQAGAGWVTPSLPKGSLAIVMSVLGAVVGALALPALRGHPEASTSRHGVTTWCASD